AEGVLHKEPIPTSRGRSQYPHLLHNHTLHSPQPDRLVNPRLHHEEADGLLGLVRYLHKVLIRSQVLTLSTQALPLTLKLHQDPIPSLEASQPCALPWSIPVPAQTSEVSYGPSRSEERRVGTEWSAR